MEMRSVPVPEDAVAFMLQQFGGRVTPAPVQGGLRHWRPPKGTRLYEACAEASAYHYKIITVVRTPDGREWQILLLWIAGARDLWRLYDPKGRVRHEVEYDL